MTVNAPAKINLNLRIHNRRPDGFHELETLMVPLELSDTLEFEVADAAETRVELSCDDPSLPIDAGNLVVRALEIFSRQTGCSAVYRAKLAKRIPAGAGLGGGSSDAAAALRAANHHFGEPCNPQQLSDLAAELGSDVPFFLQDEAALCKGRGELIEPHPIPFSATVLLVKPPFGVPTPWAYKRFAALRERDPQLQGEPQSWQGLTLQNDLEPAVFSKFTVLQVLKEELRGLAGVQTSLMSGSGATIFALFRDDDAGSQMADAAEKVIKEKFGESYWVAKTEIASTSQ